MQTPRQIAQIIAYGVGAVVLMALAGCSGMEGGTDSSSMAQGFDAEAEGRGIRPAG
jgi:hypothetical protein